MSFGGVSLFVAQGPAGSSRGGDTCTFFLFFEPSGRPFAFGCTHFLGGDLASGESAGSSGSSPLPQARLRPRPPVIQLLCFCSGGFFLLFVFCCCWVCLCVGIACFIFWIVRC